MVGIKLTSVHLGSSHSRHGYMLSPRNRAAPLEQQQVELRQVGDTWHHSHDAVTGRVPFDFKTSFRLFTGFLITKLETRGFLPERGFLIRFIRK
jgi:hypothetical protein